MTWRDFWIRHWKTVIVAILAVDLLLAGSVFYLFSSRETEPAVAAELARPTAAPTATATLWPGPGKRVTATPTLPPTVIATDVLASSGFPFGFTPTPRPTREKTLITLPHVLPVFRSNLNVATINQIYYPEPFFPPGTNNACGPVALFAGLQALGIDIEYNRLRDLAVTNGFTSYGISKGGLVGTVNAINQEWGNRLVIEHGSRYNVQDLIKQIRRGGIAIVLVGVYRSGGQWYLTPDFDNAIGHFLIVDSINLRSKTVRFAGSTLGMDRVAFEDFVRAWTRNAKNPAATQPGLGFIRQEPASDNWALIIRRRM
jgi:hypothetical protein